MNGTNGWRRPPEEPTTARPILISSHREDSIPEHPIRCLLRHNPSRGRVEKVSDMHTTNVVPIVNLGDWPKVIYHVRSEVSIATRETRSTTVC